VIPNSTTGAKSRTLAVTIVPQPDAKASSNNMSSSGSGNYGRHWKKIRCSSPRLQIWSSIASICETLK